MTYPKVCLNCDSPFEAKRASARFCGERCKNDWHTANREATSQPLPQRVGHALDDVRGLHEEHAGDWTAIVREHARRTLLTTGYLSAADFEALGVPEEHCNLPGAQIGALAAAGHMEAVTAGQVRRLTPSECEALQGFPRGWTLLEPDTDWRDYPQPDGRRYAACGDAVTVNVAYWLGRRLMQAVEQGRDQVAA